MIRKCIKLRRYSKPLAHFYKLSQTNIILRSRILPPKKPVFLPVTTKSFRLTMVMFDKLYDNNIIVMKNKSKLLIQNLKYPPPLTASNFIKNARKTTPL